MKGHLFLPLKVRPFRLLMTGQIFSDLGNWLDFIALNAILVFQWKTGPGEMGIFLVVFGLPWIVCGPLLAVWSDRYPRKTIMIGCDIARVLLVLGLYWVDNYSLLLLLVFLKGTCGAMFDPARQGMIRSTVPTHLLKQANALSQTVLTATKVLGPSLGATLLMVTSPQTAFLVEAVGFALSACFLMFLPKTRQVVMEERNTHPFWLEFREGIGHIGARPVLLFGLICSSIAMWMIFLIEGLGSVWTSVMGMPSTAYGTLVAVIGCGNVIGSLVVGAWRKAPHPLVLILGSHVVFGLLTMVSGLGSLGWMPRNLVLYACVWGIVGFANPFSTVSFSTLLQTETPEHLIGRVSSVVTAVQNAAILIAPLIGAWLAEWIGVSRVFIVSGAGLILYAIIMSIRLPRLLRSTKTVPAERHHSLPL